MKTSKIITTLATLNLVVFMSITSFANPNSGNTGDVIKTTAKNQISADKGNSDASVTTASSENEFSHLRFDVNKFINESETAEFVHNAMNYLRFDVERFVDDNEPEISEIPETIDFDYLRFDVNKFTENNTGNVTEIPTNDFDYLRFDVSWYAAENNVVTEELPAN